MYIKQLWIAVLLGMPLVVSEVEIYLRTASGVRPTSCSDFSRSGCRSQVRGAASRTHPRNVPKQSNRAVCTIRLTYSCGERRRKHELDPNREECCL